MRGLIVHTLFYPNEVRSTEEFSSDTQLTARKEIDMALSLVKAMATP